MRAQRAHRRGPRSCSRASRQKSATRSWLRRSRDPSAVRNREPRTGLFWHFSLSGQRGKVEQRRSRAHNAGERRVLSPRSSAVRASGYSRQGERVVEERAFVDAVLQQNRGPLPSWAEPVEETGVAELRVGDRAHERFEPGERHPRGEERAVDRPGRPCRRCDGRRTRPRPAPTRRPPSRCP
jgi:hypothetical protein